MSARGRGGPAGGVAGASTAGLLLATGAAAPAAAQGVGHEPLQGQVLVDRLEYRLEDGDEGVVAWEGRAWYGGDYNKLFVETEGEYGVEADAFEEAQVQVLYSRLLGYFWDVQAGVRYDFEPEPSRAYGVVALLGLAPGFFEVDLEGLISDEGEFFAELEAEYNLLITQRLFLEPRLEVELAAQDVEELGIGAGLSVIEAGLRLGYEFEREFASYVGVSYERAFGETADFAREEGGDEDAFFVLAGLRFWF